jgi:hypothetical protein
MRVASSVYARLSSVVSNEFVSGPASTVISLATLQKTIDGWF